MSVIGQLPELKRKASQTLGAFCIRGPEFVELAEDVGRLLDVLQCIANMTSDLPQSTTHLMVKRELARHTQT